MTEDTTTTPTEPNSQTDTQQNSDGQQTQPVTPALFNEGQQQQTQSQEPSQQQTQEPTQTDILLKAEDIKLPEGYEYDKTLGDSFLGILNEAKIGKDTAQKLFDLYQAQNVKMLEALKVADAERTKKFEADMAQEKESWLKQCQADKEFGGQQWEAAQAVIDRGCKQLATPEAVQLMQAYNLNTHPEIVRMFYRAGKLTGEDNSQVSGNGSTKQTDPAMIMFGESLKEYHKRRGEI